MPEFGSLTIVGLVTVLKALGDHLGDALDPRRYRLTRSAFVPELVPGRGRSSVRAPATAAAEPGPDADASRLAAAEVAVAMRRPDPRRPPKTPLRAVLNLLLGLQRVDGPSFPFTSQDLAVVRHISDRIAVMRAGRVANPGRPIR